MAAFVPAARAASPRWASGPVDAVLPFLAPSLQCPKHAPYVSIARFSTSPALHGRDNNRNRGVSVLRHTGLRKRQQLSVLRYLKGHGDIPKPTEPQTQIQGSEDHGLYGFFRDKKLFRTPVQESQHGRAWTVPELRQRTWADLHSLWWVCVRERNRLATAKVEMKRLKIGYGALENEDRDKVVKETMDNILKTLDERQTAWEQAHKLASKDPSIDLTVTDGPQLVQETYDTEALFDGPPPTEPAGGKK